MAYTSSTVQFPRFEYEENPEDALLQRRLINRAPGAQWLSPDVIALAQETLTLLPSFKENMRFKTNWWGVYHYARSTVTASQPHMIGTRAQNVPYQIRVTQHDYNWDHQAMPGRALEIVLQKVGVEPQPTEVMAILERPRSMRRKDGLRQQLVVPSPEGWRAHAAQEQSDVTSYLFAIATDLITTVSAAKRQATA